MCRMMGVVSQGPVYYDLFEEFADLATQGMCPIGAPDERGHKDGWGLACFRNGALDVYMRDAGSAPDASASSWTSVSTIGSRRANPRHAQHRCTCSSARAMAAVPDAVTRPSADSYVMRRSGEGCDSAGTIESPRAERRHPIWR